MYNPEEADFEGFSEKQRNEVIDIIKSKGGEKYRCMVKDEKLLDQILTALDPYLTSDALKQIWHAYNTNINENMNMVIATYAPKHLHLSGTISLKTRVSIAAGCQIQGHEKFWSDVISRFRIPMNEFLQKIDKFRNKKNAVAVRIRIN